MKLDYEELAIVLHGRGRSGSRQRAASTAQEAAGPAQPPQAAPTNQPAYKPPPPTDVHIVAGGFRRERPRNCCPDRGWPSMIFSTPGEGDGHHRMFIVRQGKVVWSYEDPGPVGERGDQRRHVVVERECAVRASIRGDGDHGGEEGGVEL